MKVRLLYDHAHIAEENLDYLVQLEKEDHVVNKVLLDPAENLELMDNPEHPDLTGDLDPRGPLDLAENLVGIAFFSLSVHVDLPT